MTDTFSPLAAAKTILREDADVNALTSGRVFAPELDRKSPHQNPQDMPRACVTLTNTGGGSLGPGARSRVPWTVTRLDVQSYGKTPQGSRRSPLGSPPCAHGAGAPAGGRYADL